MTTAPNRGSFRSARRASSWAATSHHVQPVSAAGLAPGQRVDDEFLEGAPPAAESRFRRTRPAGHRLQGEAAVTHRLDQLHGGGQLAQPACPAGGRGDRRDVGASAGGELDGRDADAAAGAADQHAGARVHTGAVQPAGGDHRVDAEGGRLRRAEAGRDGPLRSCASARREAWAGARAAPILSG